MAKKIAAGDLTWLLMDRPNNLMQVHGLIGFDTVPDFAKLTDLVMDRMVGKYRVLSQIPVERKGKWRWVDDKDFDIARHVTRVVLPDDDPETMRAHMSSLFSTPFPREHPLWQFQLVTGPDEDGPGYVIGRFHHGLADGIRLVQLIIGTCDPVTGATPPAVGRGGEQHENPFERLLSFAEQSVTDTVDFATGAGKAISKAGRQLVTTSNPLNLAHSVGEALETVRDPVRLMDAITSVGAVDNEWSNSWREIGRMLLADESDAGAWSGRPGVDKSVAWFEGYRLDDAKAVARAFGGTLNDALMAAVSLALTDYLSERGVNDVSDLSWLMPVSLRPVDAALPPTLGNHFAVVQISMPLGIRDPVALIAEIGERTTRLKNSAEPVVAFGMQRVIAESPLAVAQRITNYFSNKTIGLLSNVPGPRVSLTMAGAPVRTVLGWVPTSGDQPIGVCLISYAGTVGVAVATDARMIPDPPRIAELIHHHLDTLAAAAAVTAAR